jgi:hypothetical protein
MLVRGVGVHPVAVARVEANFRALAYGRVVMAPRLRSGDDASLPFGGVIAGADHPPRLPRANPCWFNVFGGLASPQG